MVISTHILCIQFIIAGKFEDGRGLKQVVTFHSQLRAERSEQGTVLTSLSSFFTVQESNPGNVHVTGQTGIHNSVHLSKIIPEACPEVCLTDGSVFHEAGHQHYSFCPSRRLVHGR